MDYVFCVPGGLLLLLLLFPLVVIFVLNLLFAVLLFWLPPTLISTLLLIFLSLTYLVFVNVDGINGLYELNCNCSDRCYYSEFFCFYCLSGVVIRDSPIFYWLVFDLDTLLLLILLPLLLLLTTPLLFPTLLLLPTPCLCCE